MSKHGITNHILSSSVEIFVRVHRLQVLQQVCPAKTCVCFNIDEPIDIGRSHAVNFMHHRQEFPFVQRPSLFSFQLAKILAFLVVFLQLAVKLKVLVVLLVAFANSLEGVIYRIVGKGLGQVGEDEVVRSAAE